MELTPQEQKRIHTAFMNMPYAYGIFPMPPSEISGTIIAEALEALAKHLGFIYDTSEDRLEELRRLKRDLAAVGRLVRTVMED